MLFLFDLRSVTYIILYTIFYDENNRAHQSMQSVPSRRMKQ